MALHVNQECRERRKSPCLGVPENTHHLQPDSRSIARTHMVYSLAFTMNAGLSEPFAQPGK